MILLKLLSDLLKLKKIDDFAYFRCKNHDFENIDASETFERAYGPYMGDERSLNKILQYFSKFLLFSHIGDSDHPWGAIVHTGVVP